MGTPLIGATTFQFRLLFLQHLVFLSSTFLFNMIHFHAVFFLKAHTVSGYDEDKLLALFYLYNKHAHTVNKI